MASETNYKRLWRNATREVIKLSRVIEQKNELIEDQAKLIRELQGGTEEKKQAEFIPAFHAEEHKSKGTSSYE